MRTAIIAGLVVLGSLLAPAATVVDLNLNLSGDVTPARAIDVNTTSNQTYNWSSSLLLFDGPVTAGNQNTKIYGACAATGSAGTLSSATVKLDEATPDRILFQCDKLPGVTNSTADLRAVAFWDATNFLTSGNTRFDDSTNSSLTIGVGSWLNATVISGIRYVIRDGTNYYVSGVKGPTGQNTNNTIYGNTAGLQWAEFDINNWATYSEADANLGLGALSFSAQTFNNVTGVGLLGAATRSAGNPPIFSITEFQARLVEPLANNFTLTVTGGSGSGFYTNGQQVAIAAYNTPYQTFVRWTGDTQYVANVNASNTTVTMPAKDIALDVTFSYFTPVSWPDMYVPVYNEMGTNYAPYPLVANDTINPTFSQQQLTSLAKNFDSIYCVKDNFTKANANYVYEVNPKFQLTAYINESHTGSMFGNYDDPWDIEQSNKTNVLYYMAGNLGVVLPATTNSITFAVSNLFSRLVASTAAAGSNVTYKAGGIYYFVTWLKIGGELMRIEAASNDTVNKIATVTVTRAFSGTPAAAHTNNTPVLVPVYFKSGPVAGMAAEFQYYGDPAAPLMAQDRLAFAMNQYTNYNRGIWEDIYGGTLNCLAMGGEPLRLSSDRFWDFRKSRIYTEDDFFNYYEEGVNSNQTNFFATYGKQLVFWANNIGSPLDFANNPETAALQSTPYKPRPLDGYAQENGIGAYQDGSTDIFSYTYNSFSKWCERLQSTMFLGENKLAALAVMMDAGVDNAKFSALPEATRHGLFVYGYASYLMAVKVETNDLIYTKFAFNPLVSGGSPVLQIDPIFLYTVGRPLETRVSTDYEGYRLPGLTTFMRQFENGLILANPGDNTNVTDVVALSRPYFDPEVSLIVTQVLMRAKSGRILLNSVSLTASAGANGAVSPTNAIVTVGGSTNFVITASNYYRIATLKTNNADVIGMLFDNDSTTTNFIWSNVTADGTLAATFTAQVTTNAPAQVPYEWLAGYGLTNYNTDATNDVDLDRLAVWEEYIAGTDPTNSASSFCVTEDPRNVLGWNAVSGRVYSVYWTTNLMNGFQCLESNIPWTQGSFTNSTDVPCGYYKIGVRLEN